MCVFGSAPKLPEPKAATIPSPSDPAVTAAGERQRRRVSRARSVSTSTFFGATPRAANIGPALAVKSALGV